jgi:ketosteroid isomerase-like protein
MIKTTAAIAPELVGTKAVAMNFLNEVFAGDLAEVAELIHDTCVFFVGGEARSSGYHTEEEFLAGLKRVLPRLGEMTLNIGTITAENDRVAIEAELHSVLPSGDVYNNQYHYLIRVTDGKISCFKEYFDTQHTLRVLGLPPMDPAQDKRASNLEMITYSISNRASV